MGVGPLDTSSPESAGEGWGLGCVEVEEEELPPGPLLTTWSSPHLPDSPDRPWSPLTFSPTQLTVLEGENATFVCSLPDVPESFVLNWYRMSPRNQTDKLAAFQENHTQPGKDRRFLVTRLPSGQDFHMTILAARLNDSGVYLCGAIYLPPNTQIYESLRAELTVKGAEPRQTGEPAGDVGPSGRDAGGCPSGSVPHLGPLGAQSTHTPTGPSETAGSQQGQQVALVRTG